MKGVMFLRQYVLYQKVSLSVLILFVFFKGRVNTLLMGKG